ncbi:MAG: hypothetical protein JWQ30_147 [Sediminibacterium sp.]|nr:hypothetical protein [Sediminibacterium sp.]
MFNDHLIKLFTIIRNASTHNLLVWEKTGLFTYETQPYEAQVLHIEKYFYGSDQASCINLTVFNSAKTDILSETVRCADSVAPKEFTMLDEIYQTVEAAWQQKENEQFSPALTHLTESLQEKLQDN